MFCILWDGIALDCRQNNMRFEQGHIRQKLRRKILITFVGNFALLVLVMIGIGKLQQVIKTIINGLNGYSQSSTRKVWHTKLKCLSIIVQLLEQYLQMKKWRTVFQKKESFPLREGLCANGY